MQKIYILFFLIIQCATYSQITRTEIDSLLSYEVTRLRRDAKYTEIVKLSNKMIIESKKINYIDGEAWGYLRKGNGLCSLGKIKESLANLKKAKELSSLGNDYALKASIAIETGRNYNESKISHKQSIKKFNEAILYANKIKDQYNRETYLLYAYQNLSTAYSFINEPDLSVNYLWKAQSIEQDLYNTLQIASFHNKHSQNKDSLKYYLDKSTIMLKPFPDYEFEYAMLYNLWGNFHEKEKEYPKAIYFFKKAEKLSKKTAANIEYLNSILSLQNCYESIGDDKQTIIYAKRFARVQDSIARITNDNINVTIDNIVKEKEENFLKKFSLLQKGFGVLVFLGLVFFSIFRLKISKNKKRLKRVNEQVKKHEYILHQKEEEAIELQAIIDTHFEEVLELAKSNSPLFWAKFQEVYPKYLPILTELNPRLTLSELTLGARVFLGFSSKEISEYTFRSLKTIENTRYSFRKKLGLSAKENLHLWLKTQIQNHS